MGERHDVNSVKDAARLARSGWAVCCNYASLNIVVPTKFRSPRHRQAGKDHAAGIVVAGKIGAATRLVTANRGQLRDASCKRHNPPAGELRQPLESRYRDRQTRDGVA
jgi:hypothetical protein